MRCLKNDMNEFASLTLIFVNTHVVNMTSNDLFPQVTGPVTSRWWHYRVEELCVTWVAICCSNCMSLCSPLLSSLSLSFLMYLSPNPSPHTFLFPFIRCPNDFTGERCQTSVMAGFYSMFISTTCLFVRLCLSALRQPHVAYNVCACTVCTVSVIVDLQVEIRGQK